VTRTVPQTAPAGLRRDFRTRRPVTVVAATRWTTQLARMIHESTLTRSVSEERTRSYARLRIGLVWRTLLGKTRMLNNPG
jgi:hypothetical protein